MRTVPRQTALLLLLFILFPAAADVYARQNQVQDVEPFRPTAYRVRFTTPLDERSSAQILAPSNVVITSTPSGGGVNSRVVSVEFLPATARRVQINLDVPLTPAAATDTQFRICFSKLFFRSASNDDGESTGTPTETTGAVCGTTPVQPESRGARLERLIERTNSTAKTSEERNVFASGFVTTGPDTKPEGGADIALNSNDLGIKGLTANLRLKKNTNGTADPKHLEIGLTRRFVKVLRKQTALQIREQIGIISDPNSTEAQREAARVRVNELVESYGNSVFGGIIFDVRAKMESEPLSFNVNNFVTEGLLQVQSRTRRLFGSRHGFFRFRFPIVGFEAGYNLAKPEESQQVTPEQAQLLKQFDWVARAKVGGVLTLFYDSPEPGGLFDRVEAEIQAVDRYLFRREVRFDETSKMYELSDKGHKPWVQADLKFYFGRSGNIRPGFKLSFMRGSLPPTFSETKTFQYGFVLESTEGADEEEQ